VRALLHWELLKAIPTPTIQGPLCHAPRSLAMKAFCEIHLGLVNLDFNSDIANSRSLNIPCDF
jgi:hypothetical protein